MLKTLTNNEISLVYGGIFDINRQDAIRLGGIFVIAITNMVVAYYKTTYNGTCDENKLAQTNHTIASCRFVNDVLPTAIPTLFNIAVFFIVMRMAQNHHPHAN